MEIGIDRVAGILPDPATGALPSPARWPAAAGTGNVVSTAVNANRLHVPASATQIGEPRG